MHMADPAIYGLYRIACGVGRCGIAILQFIQLPAAIKIFQHLHNFSEILRRPVIGFF